MTTDNLVVVDNDTVTTTLKNASAAAPEEESIVMLGSPMAIIDGVSFSSGDNWSNWANTLSAKPERLFYPTTLEDLQVIIREATDNKKKVRCVGNGHSWSGTVVTQDYMVSVNGMNQISKPVQLEDGTWTVTVESGVEVSQLDKFLREHNPPLALASNVMPSDHGAGLDSRTVCDTLTELTIVNAYGELHIYSEADDPEAFNIACVNLGLLGIIYTATIKVIPMSQYRLRAIDSYLPLESLFKGPDAGEKLKELVLRNDSIELLYWPHARFLKEERNEYFWLKQWQKTLDPVEPLDKYKNQLPTVDHPGFAAFKVGEIVKEIPDAVHFDISAEDEPSPEGKFYDASAGFKVDADFGNFVEAFNELLDRNWAFSSSDFPSRIGTALEVRFIKASRKRMSFVYDEDPESIYCVVNVLGAAGTPGPHWAKLWEHIPGIYPTLRREYKDHLAAFNRVRKSQDPFDIFVNDTWRPLIEEHEQ
ncbi:D-arabinono-1,4-lactone oxidase [Mortierella sp. 14UC]|nr:D-arabinono-1,4-lactone oxidase [Mortierella sp. 14UC]